MDEQERLEGMEAETVDNAAESGEEYMTLDDALAAAQAEIAQRESAEEAPVEETTSTEVSPTQDAPVQNEEAVPEQATDTTTVPQQTGVTESEMLRQQLAQQNGMIQQMQSQLMQAQQAMQNMQAQMQQTNQQTAQQVVSEMLTPPTFDVSSIMYASEEEQRAASQKFVDDTMQYTRQAIMQELAPMVNDFRAREADVQRRNVKDGYRNNAQYEGFQDREAWIEQLIEKNPELKQLPLNKQYEIGYLITQGVDAVKARQNPAPEPAPKTIDQRIAEAEGDAELMRALEERRVKNVANSQQNLPPNFVAGGGANRVGLNVPDEPTDFDMAREGAFSFLRGRK